MSGSINKVTLVGRLGADPDVRRLSSGDPVVKLTVATSEKWKDKNSGERKERSEFHRVVIFNEGLAKVAESYLRKGSRVYLEGQLQTRKWTDQSGQDKYTTEIVLQRYRGELQLLDSKGDDATGSDTDRSQRSGGDYSAASGGSGSTGSQPQFNDEVPFAPEFR